MAADNDEVPCLEEVVRSVDRHVVRCSRTSDELKVTVLVAESCVYDVAFKLVRARSEV